MSVLQRDKTPVFTRQSVGAMSPLAQEIAKMLQDAGYITITDERVKTGAVQ